MKTREEIIAKLEGERAKLIERYRSLPPEHLAVACTESEAPDADAWTPKDHIAHLAMIERAFQGMIHRTLDGHEKPLDLGGGPTEDIMARVHRNNQDNVDEHRSDDLDTLLADLEEARIETNRLMRDLTEEQLRTPVPGAPWGDGTIAGVLLTNAYHEVMHWNWVSEGLAAKVGG
jgi:hypothetical protein